MVTAATLLNTSLGKVIGIFNEYAYLGKGSSIHSSGQLEWFKTLVDEKSIKVGGTQLITTLDGYSVPLLIRDGLAYATSLGRPTDQDMDTYPHVFFTSPDEWDPSVLDHDPPHLDGLDPSQVSDQPFGDPMFDAYGDFNERIIANLNILLDAPPGDCGSYTSTSSVSTVNLHQSSPQEPDWNALRPFFAWTSPSSIKDTFNVTTRHGTAPHTQDYIKKHFKSRNPVFNIPRRSEAVATDTIFSDTPAVDDGSTMAQFFCGRDTLVCDAYGIKSTKQFINTLSDNIRKRGAMDTLISDGGKYEISKQVTDLLQSLFIQAYQSEPYHQHQNKAENRFGLAKRYTNTVMNTSGCTACCWLFCLQYICVVLNHLASPTLQGICPVQALKFKLKINKDQAEEIMSYNQLMDYIQKGTDAEEDPDSLFKFRDIVAHQGPLESTDPNHNGSKYNVMVEWESGEVTYEPLTLISKDDPITCAVYAKKHDLLDTTGWKHLKDMPRLPKDSSEPSSNPGSARSEHQLDINMVSKSQRITMML